MFVWLLVIAVLTSGCGSLVYDSSTTTATSASGRLQDNKAPSVQTESASKQCCDAPSVQNDATAPIPPVPVVGSFLAGFVIDEKGFPLANAKVILEEKGLSPVTKTSNAAGLVRLEIADPDNIERIAVQRKVAGKTIENFVVLSLQQRQLAKVATYPADPAGSGVPENLLEMRAGAEGSPLILGRITNPAVDKTIPKINMNAFESGGQIVVDISGSDAESGLHPLPFSFDGGATWSTQTRWFLPLGSTIESGRVQVRDRAGNKNVVNGTITP